MIYKSDGEYKFETHKVEFERNGKVESHYTHDLDYWNTFADKWGLTLEIAEVSPAQAQIQRLQDVQYIDGAHEYACAKYVETGDFPDENNHALKDLQLRKQNESQGQAQAESELNSMLQGQWIADLELQLLNVEAK